MQLSDAHIQQDSNPVITRKTNLLDAIKSIMPRPAACLMLLNGDIVSTASVEEYEVASQFFAEIISTLTPLFSGGFATVVIPGNHDCRLPEEEKLLRETLVNGVGPSIQAANPDEALLNSLLSVQENFRNFQESLLGYKLLGHQRLCSSNVFVLDGKTVQVNSFNTAFLSQRHERVGSLSIPLGIAETEIAPQDHTDITVSIYHHPDNWLDPTLRRRFRKLIEATSHFVFTGHEHEQDGRQVLPFIGDQLIYLEADALQEEKAPTKSGFNCLVLDPATNKLHRYSFIWRNSAYHPVINDEIRDVTLSAKSRISFTNNPRFLGELVEDKFGFTHKQKQNLLLQDFFIYPSLSPVQSGTNPKSERIKGNDVIEYIRKQKYVMLQGPDLCGKSSLLKSLYKDLSLETNLVPVLLAGEDFTASSEEALFSRIWSAVRYQYSNDLLEPYKQLAIERRVLLIDNWHKSRLATDVKHRLVGIAKTFFGTIVVTSNDMMALSEVYSSENGTAVQQALLPVRIREFSASGRGAIIDKWMRISQTEEVEDQSLSKDIEKEQSVLDYLIGKKTLPSLPYLIIGVLQARQNQKEEVSDPGSFGYLVQKLVLDALHLSKGKRKLVDRKDAILRRCSFEMFKNGISSLSVDEFREITNTYASDMKLIVDTDEILEDLEYGRVLEKLDGNLSFKSHHFYYYFLARHFIDEIEGPRAASIREYLNAMADRPLTKSNQLTLIFFLFFRKRDPIIDRIINQANQTFAGQPMSDMLTDTAFIDKATPALAPASVDVKVDPSAERKKRLDRQDSIELKAEAREEQGSLDLQYDDGLAFALRAEFAQARLDLLGQVIRSFPDSLDGEKKVEILEVAFKLGLRFLHAMIKVLEDWLTRGMRAIDEKEDVTEEQKKKARVFFRQLVGFFIRGCCDARLLDISRTVGVSDLERAYSEAIERVGSTPSTKLIDLAIRLDHSEGFPFRDVQAMQKSLPPEGEVAPAVLSDLVVRHTQIFKLRPDTLRKIAGLIGVKPLALYDKDSDI